MTEELALSANYETDNGTAISLNAQVVRDICGSGNNKITDREVYNFIELCKAHKLNPFIKEAYLVKYGDQPATIITGKDVFTKRAARNEKCKGYRAGVYIQTPAGNLKEREGSMVLNGEAILGGWAEVYMQGYEVPIKDTVSFAEYNTGKSAWKKMPGTMIRKVALVHALREAMPEEFGGLYDSSEMEQAFHGTEAQQAEPAEEVEVSAEVVIEPNSLQQAQKRVGDLMREAKAQGFQMHEFTAYAQEQYRKGIAELSEEQLKHFAKYIERVLHSYELICEADEAVSN